MSYLSGLAIYQILLNNVAINTFAAQLTIIAVVGAIKINSNELHFCYRNATLPFELEILNKISNIIINTNSYYTLIVLSTLMIFCKWNNRSYKHNIVFIESINNCMSMLEQGVLFCSYNYAIYYCIRQDSYYPLYDNILYVVHPVVLTVTIILLIDVALLSSWTRFFKKNTSNVSVVTNASYYFVLSALILGGLWATVSDGWGGFWSWDPSEVILLLVVCLLIYEVHTSNATRQKLLSYIIICIYTIVTKLNILPGIHNFSNSDYHIIDCITTCSTVVGGFISIALTYSILHTSIKGKYSLMAISITLFIATSCFFYLVENNVVGFDFVELLFLFNITIHIVVLVFITQVFCLTEWWFFLLCIQIFILFTLNSYFVNCQSTQIVTFFALSLYVNIKNTLEFKWVYLSHTIPIISIVVIITTYLAIKEVKLEITDEWKHVFYNMYFNVQDTYVLKKSYETDATFRKVLFNENSIFSQIIHNVKKHNFTNRYNYSYGYCITDCILSYKTLFISTYQNKISYAESFNVYNKKLFLIYIYIIVHLYTGIIKHRRYGR